MSNISSNLYHAFITVMFMLAIPVGALFLLVKFAKE